MNAQDLEILHVLLVLTIIMLNLEQQAHAKQLALLTIIKTTRQTLANLAMIVATNAQEKETPSVLRVKLHIIRILLQRVLA